MVDHVPQGSVVITPRELFEEMRGIRDEVKHLSSVVDPALARIREDIGEQKTRARTLDVRLRVVEQRLWFASGVATAAGALGGWALSALVG